MKPQELIEILNVAGRLKTTLRHCDLNENRKESVAEHCFRLSLFAMLLRDEFPDTDINKVIRMCLIHDLGEAFTGDIPTFLKTQEDEREEKEEFYGWIHTFPSEQKEEFLYLLKEIDELKTPEARLFKALDKLEAVISHNESDISSWLPNEYELQLTYASKEVEFSPYLCELKKTIDLWTKEKISVEGK